MKTIKVNGREYRIKDVFPVSAYRRIAAISDGIQSDEEKLNVRMDNTLFEMLLDENGERYASIDMMLDTVDVRDVPKISAAIYGNDDDPLAKTTDSVSD